MLLVVGAACADPGQRRPGTVLFASGADLQSMNPLITLHPLARQVQRYVLLTTLVRYDSALQVQPYLARRWEWSADGRRLTMHLFDGLHWHDGPPTTARDAAFTLNAARDPVTGYPRQRELGNVDTAFARDDSTLVVQYRAAPDGIPDVLTDLAIAPAHWLDTVPRGRMREAAWNQTPVGNGPFRFVTHEPNRRWVFSADSTFPALLGGPPRLDRLVVAIVDEPTTKLAALTAGELDFAGINPAHASFVELDPGLAVLSYPLIFTYGLILNMRRPPFDDPLVRRAISLAVNRQEIVQGYIYGFGMPAWGPVPPGLPGARTPEPVPWDPDSARRLLAGREVHFDLLTVGSGEAALEQMVQAQLANAGIRVTIRQMELSAFLDRVYREAPSFEAAVTGIPGDPGLGYLAPLATVAGMEAAGNAAALQARFRESNAVVFLYHARGVQGMNPRVRDVRMDLRGELPTVTRWYTASMEPEP